MKATPDAQLIPVRALNQATSRLVAAATTGLTITGTILTAGDEAGKDGALRQ